jgi:hypothetical protein
VFFKFWHWGGLGRAAAWEPPPPGPCWCAPDSELNVFIFIVTVQISKSLGTSRVDTIALLMHCSETEIFICFTGGKVFEILHYVEFDKTAY